MIIFIDGLDNVGKTTQIKKILNHFNKDVFLSIHHTNVKQESSEEAIKQTGIYTKSVFDLVRYQIEKGHSLIADRCHLSEMVYSEIYRGYDASYVYDIETANLDLMDKITLITLIDEPENVIARDDGNSFSVDIEDKKREIDLFLNAAATSFIQNKWNININGKDEDEVFKIILSIIEK